MFSSSNKNGHSRIFKGVRTTPKGFNYQPRYYDEDKERLEKRKAAIEAQVKRAEERGEEFRITDQVTVVSDHGRKQRAAAARSRLIRLAIILSIILWAARWVWTSSGQ